MTKQEILDAFKDINFAYNNSSKYETLSDMLDELLKEQEPKKGHWIMDPDGMDWNLSAWRCSECGGRNDCLPTHVDGKPVKNIYRWAGSQYCPNCGAKMEETEK